MDVFPINWDSVPDVMNKEQFFRICHISKSTAMHDYYAKLLEDYDDVMTVNDISALTGYGKTTINKWCCSKYLKSFQSGRLLYIPKIFLTEFFCSQYFRLINRKTLWHIQTLNEFQLEVKWRK